MQQIKLPAHRLTQFCKTRWNSFCEMFQRLLEQRWQLWLCCLTAVTKLQDARILELKDEYWQPMESMVPVLGALKLCNYHYVH